MRRSKSIRYTLSDRVFLACNWLVLSLFLAVLVYPLLFVVSASFSGGASVMSLSLIPKQFSVAGYRAVIEYEDIWKGYANSLFYMAAGTLVSLLTTIFCAYPLSRRDFRAGGVMMMLCMMTMYFSGGMIPTFLVVRNLGLLDSRWAVILPGALSVYNMIVMRTYFRSQIPGEILESAQLDGCGNIQYLFHILLPLSVPILAVIGLFYAVACWNSYFDAMIYLKDRAKFPLALILREILLLGSSALEDMETEAIQEMQERRRLMQYSVIIVSSLPVMIAYPFVQKYFVKGIMIGAVKG